MIVNFITKKLIRLKNSSKILKLFYYYHYLFNDKKHGNIGFDFTTKKSKTYIPVYRDEQLRMNEIPELTATCRRRKVRYLNGASA